MSEPTTKAQLINLLNRYNGVRVVSFSLRQMASRYTTLSDVEGPTQTITDPSLPIVLDNSDEMDLTTVDEQRITRAIIKDYLMENEFLLRASVSAPGKLALSRMVKGEIQHLLFSVRVDNGCLYTKQINFGKRDEAGEYYPIGEMFRFIREQSPQRQTAEKMVSEINKTVQKHVGYRMRVC